MSQFKYEKPKRQPRRQPRVKGGRAHLSPSVLHSIDNELRRIARINGVSVSWIVADYLAEALGIKEQTWFAKPQLRRVK